MAQGVAKVCTPVSVDTAYDPDILGMIERSGVLANDHTKELFGGLPLPKDMSAGTVCRDQLAIFSPLLGGVRPTFSDEIELASHYVLRAGSMNLWQILTYVEKHRKMILQHRHVAVLGTCATDPRTGKSSVPVLHLNRCGIIFLRACSYEESWAVGWDFGLVLRPPRGGLN